ncbi:MAG: ROK family transcriptional regulator [Spirochaetota bacterium]
MFVLPFRRSTPQQFQRETNLTLVLRSLRDVGPSSRSELATRIGIDRSTMTSIATDLLATGIVTEGSGEPSGARGGRRPRLLTLNQERVVAVGVQLGEDTAEWSVCALGGTEIDRGGVGRGTLAEPKEWASCAFGELSAYLASWKESHRDRSPLVAGVGLGVSGIVEPRLGILRESTVLGARDLDLGRIWKESRGSEPRPLLLVDNDANCCAWNIARDEPSSGTTIFVQLSLHHAETGGLRPTLGGVGLSFVIDGRVYYGSSHAAGELRGYRWTEAHTDQLGLSQLSDRAVSAVVARMSEELLRNLGVIASALDPARIVLGGDLAGRYALVAEQLATTLSGSSIAPLFESGVLQVAAPTEYPVSLGAAQMVLHEIFSLPTVGGERDPGLGWQTILERLRSVS